MSTELSGAAPAESIAGQGASWGSGPSARWRENPERMAWFVLLASFGVFVLLLIMVPLTVNYTIRYATVSHSARLEPTLGTLLLYTSEAAEPIAITAPREDVAEGYRIVAGDESTQGTLDLIGVDNTSVALGSVQIYPGAVLEVEEIRRPFFSSSPEPYRVVLRLEKGQARIFTNSGDQRELDVELMTPHGAIQLAAGSYQVAVSPEQTNLTVRLGQAQLSQADSETVLVDAGLRTWMSEGDILRDPVSAEQNLLANGDFSQSMQNTWQSYVIAENVIPGSVRSIERDGRRVAHFIRQGEENVPTEVGITQEVNKDVNVYDELFLQLDVKLLHQSLSGAGYLSSEFPLRVELTYTDIYGKVLTWGHGFYYRDPENENWRVIDGEKIPPFKWYTYQSPNLMEELQSTRPAHIDSVRIYASGWNYQSMVSEAYLVAR
ncbi:MAG: hypothetical protein HC802_17765 [Caldilineaceae bacterium]|nr:hypothetical protein [Caldilineaceae bacterium]